MTHRFLLYTMGKFFIHRIFMYKRCLFIISSVLYTFRSIPFSHTMTSRIPLCDIIEAINDFLIQNPTILPIIISLENHCSLPYQEVMAKLFIQIFGNRLYIPSEQSLQGSLPSPNRYESFLTSCVFIFVSVLNIISYNMYKA